jgi:hypothetical protein
VSCKQKAAFELFYPLALHVFSSFHHPGPTHQIVAFFGKPVDNRAASAVVFQWDCS